MDFLKEVLAKLESREGIRVVGADSGFFAQELLPYRESRERFYLLAARLTRWLKREAARVEAWRALDGTSAVGEFRLQLLGWDRERRFGVVREQGADSDDGDG